MERISLPAGQNGAEFTAFARLLQTRPEALLIAPGSPFLELSYNSPPWRCAMPCLRPMPSPITDTDRPHTAAGVRKAPKHEIVPTGSAAAGQMDQALNSAG